MKQISITSILILAAFGLLAQEKLIKGKITDEYGAAIGAATIHLLNSNIWTSTSNEGIFQLKLQANGKYIFSITSIGYSTKTQEVDLNENVLTLPDIQLSPIARQLDAVVVSAEKTEQLVQNIPISISSFSSRQVNEFRLWNINELSTIVPALYAADPGDKRNVVSVRGITSTSYDPAVTTYIDGVNQFTLDMYIPQLFDVERIEVLRGPQGTLYGRNAMGGVINIITKQPTNNTNLFAEISAGNHEQQRYSVAVRTPVIRDKLFFGGSLLYDKRAGFYTNEYDNSSFDKQHSFAGNYYLKYLVAPTWTLTLNAKHVANRNSGPFPLVIGKDEALARPFILNQNAIGNLVDNIFNGSLSIDRSGEGIVFSSQTSYQANYRYYSTPIDGDFSAIDGVTIINDYGKKWNNVKAVTQEFKIASPIESASKLKWTTGLYLFYHHAPNKQATHFGNDATLLGSPDSNYSIINTARIKNFGAAFYAQGVYSFNKKLDAIVGIRYDHQHSQQQVFGEYQPDAAPAPIFETQ